MATSRFVLKKCAVPAALYW